MAKIHFKCSCGKQLAVDEQHAGKVAKCPACQRPLRVPDSENAPAPEKIDVGANIASLSNAYGEALLTRARQKRVSAALEEIEKRARKRKLIAAACAACVLVLGFGLYKLLQGHGVSPGRRDRYPEEVRVFLSGCTDSDARVRAAAVWEMADAAPKDQACLAQIGAVAQNDESPFVRIVAIRTLARTDKSAVVTYVKPLLGDRALDVRMAAAFALGQSASDPLSPRSLAPYLTEVLKAHSEWLAWLDDVVQGRAADPAVFLASYLRDRNPRVRSLAAWMTAATLGPNTRLLELSRDTDPAVAASALYALEPFLSADAFGRARPSEGVIQNLRGLLGGVAPRLRDEAPEVRTAAVLVLAQSREANMAHLFSQALQDSDWFVRFAALKALSKLEPKTALETLNAARKDDGPRDNQWTRRVRERIEQGSQAEKAAKTKS